MSIIRRDDANAFEERARNVQDDFATRDNVRRDGRSSRQQSTIMGTMSKMGYMMVERRMLSRAAVRSVQASEVTDTRWDGQVGHSKWPARNAIAKSC